mgnify:CR=1 FL=1
MAHRAFANRSRLDIGERLQRSSSALSSGARFPIMKNKPASFASRWPHALGIERCLADFIGIARQELHRRCHPTARLNDMGASKMIDRISIERLTGSRIGSRLNACVLRFVVLETPCVI